MNQNIFLLPMNDFLINALGIAGAAILFGIIYWLISIPVNALTRYVKHQLQDYPAWTIVIETILEYVPTVFGLAGAATICYYVYGMLGIPADHPVTEGTFYASSMQSTLVDAFCCLIGVALAIAVPIVTYRKRDQIATRWKCLLGVLELFMIHLAVSMGLALTLPTEGSITITGDEIAIHHGPHYGFFYDLHPAQDITIPASQVVSWQMKAKYSNSDPDDDTVSSYTGLRIQYNAPHTSAMQQEYLDLGIYSTDDQFAIHHLLSTYY